MWSVILSVPQLSPSPERGGHATEKRRGLGRGGQEGDRGRYLSFGLEGEELSEDSFQSADHVLHLTRYLFPDYSIALLSSDT
jgi:hypothetical protein